jgi:hypothetical protein
MAGSDRRFATQHQWQANGAACETFSVHRSEFAGGLRGNEVLMAEQPAAVFPVPAKLRTFAVAPWTNAQQTERASGDHVHLLHESPFPHAITSHTMAPFVVGRLSSGVLNNAYASPYPAKSQQVGVGVETGQLSGMFPCDPKRTIRQNNQTVDAVVPPGSTLVAQRWTEDQDTAARHTLVYPRIAVVEAPAERCDETEARTHLRYCGTQWLLLQHKRIRACLAGAAGVEGAHLKREESTMAAAALVCGFATAINAHLTDLRLGQAVGGKYGPAARC